jgi:hypothetical protein
MFLKQRVYDGNVFVKFGLFFLATANIGSYLLRRGNAYPESISDPVSGFLFGLAFGCLGLGLWKLRRRKSA